MGQLELLNEAINCGSSWHFSSSLHTTVCSIFFSLKLTVAVTLKPRPSRKAELLYYVSQYRHIITRRHLPFTVTFTTLLTLLHITDVVHETSGESWFKKYSCSVKGQFYYNTKMADTYSAKTALCYTPSDSFTALATTFELFAENISRQNAVKWDCKLNIRPYRRCIIQLSASH